METKITICLNSLIYKYFREIQMFFKGLLCVPWTKFLSLTTGVD